MTTYLSRLRETTQQPATPTGTFVPLTDQIAALTAPLPPVQLHRPWTIAELLPQLQGRYQARPAARDVAQALTQLRWRRKRCWKKTGRNRRFWYPPSEKEIEK